MNINNSIHNFSVGQYIVYPPPCARHLIRSSHRRKRLVSLRNPSDPPGYKSHQMSGLWTPPGTDLRGIGRSRLEEKKWMNMIDAKYSSKYDRMNNLTFRRGQQYKNVFKCRRIFAIPTPGVQLNRPGFLHPLSKIKIILAINNLFSSWNLIESCLFGTSKIKSKGLAALYKIHWQLLEILKTI